MSLEMILFYSAMKRSVSASCGKANPKRRRRQLSESEEEEEEEDGGGGGEVLSSSQLDFKENLNRSVSDPSWVYSSGFLTQ